MSHFPAAQPYSSVFPPGEMITQEDAVATGNLTYATYSTALNFGVGATDPYLFFTTASDRGRFFPIHVNITAVNGMSQGLAAVTGPVVRIGWTNRSNPYDNWVNQVGLVAPLQDSFGPGQYDNDVELYTQWEAYKSAAPGTPIYIDLAPGSGAADVRVVTLVGIYTG